MNVFVLKLVWKHNEIGLISHDKLEVANPDILFQEIQFCMTSLYRNECPPVTLCKYLITRNDKKNVKNGFYYRQTNHIDECSGRFLLTLTGTMNDHCSVIIVIFDILIYQWIIAKMGIPSDKYQKRHAYTQLSNVTWRSAVVSDQKFVKELYLSLRSLDFQFFLIYQYQQTESVRKWYVSFCFRFYWIFSANTKTLQLHAVNLNVDLNLKSVFLPGVSLFC